MVAEEPSITMAEWCRRYWRIIVWWNVLTAIVPTIAALALWKGHSSVAVGSLVVGAIILLVWERSQGIPAPVQRWHWYSVSICTLLVNTACILGTILLLVYLAHHPIP
jgi:NhaP-type Na+/H+ or K+/H+ antiporter